MSRVVMSFVDHPPDWLKEIAGGLRDFIDLEPGAPKPLPNQQKQDQRGLVVPGYKYLGPLNGLDKGPPVNKADAVAKEHDIEYDKLLKEGDNPYLKYNHADAEFQNKLQEDTSWGGNLGRAVFQAKKRVLAPFGLVEEAPVKTAPGKKRPLSSPQISPDSSSGVGKKGEQPSRKRLNFDDAQDGSSETSPSGGGGEPSGNMATDIVASGAGAPMGDAQQGADGVGNASGDWHCDSEWMGDRVITKSTRTWVLPSYNNHLYKEIKSDGNGLAGSSYFGYSTPWGYFDFNRFHSHWSPRDWQRLVNNHWGFRPKAMHVKIFNIQVKEVTTQDQTTTVANNLTSTIQVFADTEYQLPYVQGNATEGCLPAFPPEVFTLPQYGYATLNRDDTNKDRPTDRSSFWCLEYFPSKMLRTGNNFEFVYNFENVPFHVGFAPSQNLWKTANPLVDSYLYRLSSTGTLGELKFRKILKGNYAQQYKNYFPGYHVRTQGYDTVTQRNNRVNMDVASKANTMWLDGDQYAAHPMPNGMANTKREDAGLIAIENSVVFNNQPADPGSTADLPVNNVFITKENESAAVNPLAFTQNDTDAANQQGSSTDAVVGSYTRGLLPGSVWMERDVYLQGPIWAKIPDTGANFHPSPALGGFGLKKPPPMLLIKNTPVPAYVTTFTEKPVNSFITQYSTGQVTVEMEWELLKENSKRWNPEIQFTNNFRSPTLVDFAPDSSGEYRTTRSIGTRFLTKPL